MADFQNAKVVYPKNSVDKSYPVSYIISALIAGLILGILFSLVWFKTGTSSNSLTITGTSNSESITPTTTITNGSASTSADTNMGGILSIDDQAAGTSVVIKKAQVSSDQWVVIRESKKGEPGNTLGAARFLGGATSGTVELLRSTQAGSTYYGFVYKDNGDHTFSLADDKQVVDSSGNSVLVSFTAH